MRHMLLAGLTLALLAGSAFAAPPTAAQKDAFYAACVKNSDGNTTLCTCKADAAMTLIDSDFMAVVISSMTGTTPDDKYAVPYNNYIAASTRACGMGF